MTATDTRACDDPLCFEGDERCDDGFAGPCRKCGGTGRLPAKPTLEPSARLRSGWLVAINYEGHVELTPIENEADAMAYFVAHEPNWSDSWLCRVVRGPRDIPNQTVAPIPSGDSEFARGMRRAVTIAEVLARKTMLPGERPTILVEPVDTFELRAAVEKELKND